MAKATVIRVIKYEGDEDAVRKAIQLSKKLGVTVCGTDKPGGYWQMTIAEHFNDLPNLVQLTDEEVSIALEKVNEVS